MFISRSSDETRAFGRELGERAGAGDVFALVGDLGAGKTQLVSGIAAGLGTATRVTSPTFTILHEYEGGRLPLYHFDFYRLNHADEALMVGFDELVFAGGVAVIEWADRFPALIPPQTQWLRFTVEGENSRTIAEIAAS